MGHMLPSWRFWHDSPSCPSGGQSLLQGLVPSLPTSRCRELTPLASPLLPLICNVSLLCRDVFKSPSSYNFITTIKPLP